MKIKLNTTFYYKVNIKKIEINNKQEYLPSKQKESKNKFKQLLNVLDKSKFQEIEGKLIKSNVFENSEYTKTINGGSSGTIYIKNR